jgi:con80 domain of Katanin
VDVWDAPVRQRSALPSAEAVSKAALDGRDDFLKVLASRRSEIKVIRHIWSQRGACAALSHIGKLRNLSIAVDVLQAIAGVGFPKWPQFVDLDWLVELTPVLVSLLQSDFEE